MSAHTPGPWFIRDCDDNSHQCMTVISSLDYGPNNSGQHAEEDDTLAIVFHQNYPGVSNNLDDQGDANARLIAAAPDLLAALQAVIRAEEARSWGVFGVDGKTPLDAARASIARATGEAS